MKVVSPFDNQTEARIISKINTKEIITGYMKTYNMDVSNNFKNLEFVYICECPLSLLRFYYPFNLDGDGQFYKELSMNDWYYSEDRWEHKEIVEFIKPNSTVLEIGSGDGVFLKTLSTDKKIEYTGLELNLLAIEKAKLKNIHLTNDLLSEHVSDPGNIGKYDVVCSFQVLEHISVINSIMVDSIKALKPDGVLIIAVPNNDAFFIKQNTHPSRYLNMPPHHVNLFNEASLVKLAEVFNLKINRIFKEPLHDNQIDVLLHNISAKIVLKNSFLLKVLWRLKIHIPFRPIVRLFRKRLTGHTIIVVYEKNN